MIAGVGNVVRGRKHYRQVIEHTTSLVLPLLSSLAKKKKYL